MTEMTLREVCQTYGVSRRAVQGYEKAKLVSPSNRTERGYLLYNDVAIERIKLIKLFQDMGFSMKEITRIIDASAEIKRTALIQRKAVLESHIQYTSDMIDIIQEMLSTL